MLFGIHLAYIFLIRPLLEARAEIQKYFRWFFESNEKFRIFFRVQLTFSNLKELTQFSKLERILVVESDMRSINQFSRFSLLVHRYWDLFPSISGVVHKLKSVYKRMSLYKCPLYDHSWPFLCHMCVYLSQN